MSIELKTHKILWGKSGNRCAYPNCKRELVMDASETDDESVIGEEAHIVSRREKGPRGNSPLTTEQRDKYDNLMLLCSVHHKLVDDQEKKYTVELLHEYKSQHEQWVSSNLAIDRVKEREELIYAGYLDKVIDLGDVEKWKIWTSYVFGSGRPHIFYGNLKKLRQLVEYILSRIWPGRYPDLERALLNIKAVSNDFINVFEERARWPDRKFEDLDKENSDDTMIWTEAFYNTNRYEKEKYDLLSAKYEYHCYLVEDLALELTRAFNHLFDLTRLHLFSAFRIKEGVLLITSGPDEEYYWTTFRAEYKPEEKAKLYPGLRAFMKEREERNINFGKGISEDYFKTF